MATYTTEVLSIVRNSVDDKTLNIRDMIIAAEPKIFDFPYPIWEETYRPVLNTKIIRHYIRREIAHETVGLWKLFLETRMNEIMPYYNQLYLTTLEQFDGTNDIDLTTIFHRDLSSNLQETGTGNTHVSGDTVGKDYPQSASSTSAAFYASQSQAVDNTTIGDSSRHADSTGDEDTTQTRKGRTGARTQGEIINAFREAIINIDVLIINDLSDLFFGLYPIVPGGFSFRDDYIGLY